MRRILAAAAVSTWTCMLPSMLQGAPPTGPHPEHEVTAQGVVYKLPGMDRVSVKKDVVYKRSGETALRLDLYYPPDFDASKSAHAPAVVFINGVGDGGGAGSLKDWNVYQSWGRLVAASGWIGVTFEARGPFRESGPDITDLFRFLRSDGKALGIQTDRVAAWVCSGNVASGLAVLMADTDPGLRAAVVYYGTSDAPKIRTDLPVFFVKAGRDNPKLNGAIDHLLSRAAIAGAPWTVVYAPTAHHAFDALDETPESRAIVRQTLAFLREHLAAEEPQPPPSPARQALGHWFAGEYADAETAYAAYVKTHPDDAVAWMRLGLSQAHLHRSEAAQKSLQKAVSLGADGPTDFYNVACGFALAGEAEQAIGWLERAVAAGFRNKALLSSDEDLQSLRGSERFQKILAALP